MSQWTEATNALKATGDVAAFVATVANDLAKDFQAFSALPGVQAFEQWLAAMLLAELSKIGLSPVLTSLIAQAVQDGL